MCFCSQRRLCHALLVAAAATLCVPVSAARAAEADSAKTSLALIPADAAFYSTMLRNREQIEVLVQSKAWAKLTALPLYQLALKQLQNQLANPDPQLAEILKLYEMPENKQLVALLGEMVSDEVFLYGGDNFSSLLELIKRLNTGNRNGQLNLLMKGGVRPGDGANPAIVQARIVLNVLRDNLDLLQTPELVVGFRIKDAKAAEAQLQRLEQVLEALTEQVPLLKGRLKKTKVKGRTFLSLALDGKMVPWDQTPLRDVEEKEGDYDGLIKKLTKMKLSISLGVRGHYLLLAIGESLDGLDRLGGNGPKLKDRPEFKPLARVAGKPLTAIAYASKNLLARATTTPEDIDGMADLAKSLLGNAPLPDAQKKRIAKDLDGMARDVKAVLPEPGAMMAFAYPTENGYESFSYSWMKAAGKPEAAPLTLLKHVGGNPILAVLGRSQYDPDRYRTLVKWLKVIHGHLEEFALGQIPDEGKEAYEKFGKTIYPLLKRLDDITGKMLLPAFAEGQTALVLDGKWKSKHWHLMAPATPEAMPLPELGIVFGVSDPALLIKAMTAYRTLVNDALAAARELSQGMVPDLKAPPPESKEVKGGTLYFYSIPAVLGVDPQVAPTAGLGQRVAVLALSRTHAERLLAPRRLQVEGGPLADAEKPLLGAIYFNWPALIDLAQPWIELGVQTALAQGKGDLPAGIDPEQIMPQVQTLLEILKVFKGSSSATYLEDGVTVTHDKTILKDLK